MIYLFIYLFIFEKNCSFGRQEKETIINNYSQYLNNLLRGIQLLLLRYYLNSYISDDYQTKNTKALSVQL